MCRSRDLKGSRVGGASFGDFRFLSFALSCNSSAIEGAKMHIRLAVASWLIIVAIAFPQLASAQLVLAPPAERLSPSSREGGTIAGLGADPFLLAQNEALGGFSVDRSGTRMVSIDYSRSIQLWDVPTGRKVRTIWTPQGEGPLGDLSAIVISPDGSTVAAAWRSDTTAAIYLLNVGNGTVKRRIDGISDVITDIRFSADGQRVASMSINGTAEVFDANRGVSFGRTSTCSANAYSVDFDPSGTRIVTSCTSGDISIYKIDSGRLLLEGSVKSTSVGVPPLSARYSPSGRWIAITYACCTVRIRDASTLSEVTMLRRTLAGSNPMDIFWSPDEQHIWAYDVLSTDHSRVWRWDAAPIAGSALPITVLSPYTTFSVRGPIIGAIRGLPGGRVLLVSRAPAWGVMSPEGEIDWKWQGGGARMANYALNTAKPLKLLVSADGRRVGFNYLQGQLPATFDLSSRSIYEGHPNGLAPPKTAAPGIRLKLTGVLGMPSSTAVAELNGKKLPLDPRELASSAAVHPSGDRFALGTVTHVRMFDKSGRLLWRRPAKVVGVNISGDGQWVITDNFDGVIRWYRASDGQLVLSFLPDPDRIRWVVWTPSGYYDNSEGGDDLIGWLVNRGLSQTSDFFPASRFADRMRRPDLISRVLQAGGEEPALQQANAASGRTDAKVTNAVVASSVPPAIDLVSAPSDFTTPTVTVQVRIRTPGDAPLVGAPRIKINGRWVAASRAATQVQADGARNLVLGPLDTRDVVVEIYADNRNGPSVPLKLQIKWKGKTGPAKPVPAVQKPKLVVVAIGVSDYRRSELRLEYADDDARRFAAALKKQEGRRYSQVLIRQLIDGEATRKDVQTALAWLQTQVGPNDVAVLYIAGHGFQTPDENYVFAGADFDPIRPWETGVDYRLIRDTLRKLSGTGGRALFVVDTCHSGGVVGGNLGASNAGTLATTLSRPEYGVVVLTASKKDQLSYEGAEWGGGAFTSAILEGILDGRGDSAGTGEVTVFGLGAYVMARVPALTDRRQSPMFMTSPDGTEDFPVAAR